MRIFTPVAELPFAGHPTLGTAFVLAGPMQLPEIRLEMGIGTVAVTLERDGNRIVFGRMKQPIPTWEVVDDAAVLPGGSRSRTLGASRRGLRQRHPHVYVMLGSEDEVAALRPDFATLAELPVLHTDCFSGAGGRWKSRMFAPADGVPEDPATGSAAGPLAVHLARHGKIGFGEEVEISQGAEVGRPSTLHARVAGSAEAVERVEVGGSAVIVARGEFRLP